MVYVTHFESGSFSGKTARSQCGKSSLVSQLRQRIVLVHELGQLRTSEKFLDCSRNRSNIHQRLRRCYLNVLNGHSFLNHTFHSGKTDTELILEQFSYSSQSSVAQMVDVISDSNAIIQV